MDDTIEAIKEKAREDIKKAYKEFCDACDSGDESYCKCALCLGVANDKTRSMLTSCGVSPEDIETFMSDTYENMSTEGGIHG